MANCVQKRGELDSERQRCPVHHTDVFSIEERLAYLILKLPSLALIAPGFALPGFGVSMHCLLPLLIIGRLLSLGNWATTGASLSLSSCNYFHDLWQMTFNWGNEGTERVERGDSCLSHQQRISAITLHAAIALWVCPSSAHPWSS